MGQRAIKNQFHLYFQISTKLPESRPAILQQFRENFENTREINP